MFLQQINPDSTYANCIKVMGYGRGKDVSFVICIFSSYLYVFHRITPRYRKHMKGFGYCKDSTEKYLSSVWNGLPCLLHYL